MIIKNGKKFCTSFFLSFPVPCSSQGSVSSWKVEPKNSLSRWYYLELNDNMKNHFIIEHLSNACTFALSLNQKKKIIYRLQDWNHNIYLSFDALRKFLLPKIKTFVRVFINNILQYYNIYIYIYIYIYIHICMYIYKGYYMAAQGYKFYLWVLKVSLRSEWSEQVRDTFSTRR